MHPLGASGFAEFARLALLFRRTRELLDVISATGELPAGGTDVLANETLPHVDDIEDGFHLLLRPPPRPAPAGGAPPRRGPARWPPWSTPGSSSPCCPRRRPQRSTSRPAAGRTPTYRHRAGRPSWPSASRSSSGACGPSPRGAPHG